MTQNFPSRQLQALDFYPKTCILKTLIISIQGNFPGNGAVLPHCSVRFRYTVSPQPLDYKSRINFLSKIFCCYISTFACFSKKSTENINKKVDSHRIIPIFNSSSPQDKTPLGIKVSGSADMPCGNAGAPEWNVRGSLRLPHSADVPAGNLVRPISWPSADTSRHAYI